jgi:hypothetical protein
MTRLPQVILGSMLGLTLLAPAQAFARSPNLAAQNYRQADANKDGVLDQAEFAMFIDLNAADGLGKAARVRSRGMHAEAFRRVDGNGDGRVTPTELRAMSQR